MILGIDIGGTTIKAGIVEKGEIIKAEHRKTPETKEEFIATVLEITTQLYEQYKEHITSIGVGCPGPLDTQKGILLNTPNLPQNTDLGTPLRDAFSVPVVFDNDANCFTLGEAFYGAGKEKNIVLGITLGTGFGAGLCINKKLYQGRGNALELGHAIINCTETTQIPHLPSGAVEQYVSKSGLLRIAAMYDLTAPEPLDIFQLAEVKNDKAIHVWKLYGEYLGVVVVNCIATFDPEIIVIGGSMNQAWKYFEESMFERIKQSHISSIPSIVRASLKEGGIIGASVLVEGL